MIHSDLIDTIVFAVIAAFVGGFVAMRLRIPPIVGYLLAGVALGPGTPGGSADISIALDLADVGVILLMFGVGLHFSIGDLLSVRKIAVPGALAQICAATALGIGLSQLWGWNLTEGLILGLSLSVASTVVLLRALEERGLLAARAGHIAVGWLIVEDVFTVAVLVLLPAVFGEDGRNGEGLAAFVAGDNIPLAIVLALVQAAVFVTLMLVVGTKAIPALLKEISRIGSRELFTLCILAIALGVAFASSELFGVSLALGAFLAGVVLNESDLSERAATEALPFRDAFAVIFFVSVGMLFDPSILIDAPERVLAVVGIIVVGKSLAALAIVVLMGHGVRTGLVVSAGLAQVGEFSFILVALAISLGEFSEEGRNLVLAGAICSITVNPLLFQGLDTAGRWISSLSDRVPVLHPLLRPRPTLALGDEPDELERHVVVCGYGTVGRELVAALETRQFKCAVVESDPHRFDELKGLGVPAVYGDASSPAALDACHVERARIVAVTFAGRGSARMVLSYAKERNPHVDVIVRSRSPEDYEALLSAGASEVVQPELEAGLEFVRHTLHRFGVDRTQLQALLARRRRDAYRQR